MLDEKPKRCIDSVIKFCQECRLGWVKEKMMEKINLRNFYYV